MSFGIIVKNYEHINRSFPHWDTPKGKYIRSKKHYLEEMKRGGFVAYEEGARIAEQTYHKNDYKGLNPVAENVIKAARLISDSKGRIKPSDRLIEGMKEVGVKFNVPDWCPKKYKEA